MQLESPLDCVVAAAKQAHSAGARVILNPAPARPLPAELLQAMDVLIPNESETELLTGQEVSTLPQAQAASRALLHLGPKAVIITLGSRGALVISKEGNMEHLTSHAVEVVDTTAAGDAFVAGVAVGLGEGLPLEDAARLGNAAGALAVTRTGAQPAMPWREETQTLFTARSRSSRLGRV